jgi:hypothetical protein
LITPPLEKSSTTSRHHSEIVDQTASPALDPYPNSIWDHPGVLDMSADTLDFHINPIGTRLDCSFLMHTIHQTIISEKKKLPRDILVYWGGFG